MMLPSTTSSGARATAVAMESLGSRSDARPDEPPSGDGAARAGPRAPPRNRATTDKMANRWIGLQCMELPPELSGHQSGWRYLIVVVHASARPRPAIATYSLRLLA